MPILQYKCENCGKKFEELVQKYDDPVRCPDCGGSAVRDWNGEMFSATGKPSKVQRQLQDVRWVPMRPGQFVLR